MAKPAALDGANCCRLVGVLGVRTHLSVCGERC